MIGAYSSFLGRFINRDSIGEDGGANLYGYVTDDPVLLADPDGTDALGAEVGGFIGGVVGGAIGKGNPAAIEEGADIGSKIGSTVGDIAKGVDAASNIAKMAKDQGKTNVSNEYNRQAERNCSGRGFNAAETKQCICDYLDALGNFFRKNAAESKKLDTARKWAGCDPCTKSKNR